MTTAGSCVSAAQPRRASRAALGRSYRHPRPASQSPRPRCDVAHAMPCCDDSDCLDCADAECPAAPAPSPVRSRCRPPSPAPASSRRVRQHRPGPPRHATSRPFPCDPIAPASLRRSATLAGDACAAAGDPPFDAGGQSAPLRAWQAILPTRGPGGRIARRASMQPAETVPVRRHSDVPVVHGDSRLWTTRSCSGSWAAHPNTTTCKGGASRTLSITIAPWRCPTALKLELMEIDDLEIRPCTGDQVHHQADVPAVGQAPCAGTRRARRDPQPAGRSELGWRNNARIFAGHAELYEAMRGTINSEQQRALIEDMGRAASRRYLNGIGTQGSDPRCHRGHAARRSKRERRSSTALRACARHIAGLLGDTEELPSTAPSAARFRGLRRSLDLACQSGNAASPVIDRATRRSATARRAPARGAQTPDLLSVSPVARNADNWELMLNQPPPPLVRRNAR